MTATATPTATLKKSIKPVEFVITVTATRVNENGTFSGLTVKSVKSALKNAIFRVATPIRGGGAMYIKCDNLDGLDFLADGAPSTPKTKLF